MVPIPTFPSIILNSIPSVPTLTSPSVTVSTPTFRSFVTIPLATVTATPRSACVAETRPTKISGVPCRLKAVDATAVRVPLNSPSVNVENPGETISPRISPAMLPINPPQGL